MIDIDTPEEAKLFLKIADHLNLQCSVLKTSKGIHAYFKGYDLKANQIEWYSPIGIQVTTRLGTKNTADPLRIAGKTRKWLRKSEKHEPLPKWLYPMDKRKNHITEIESGSRNQELFNYILKLQSVDMRKDEIRKTIKIINEFVLEDPLDQSEINTILRDEAFMKESFFTKSNGFLHDKFAKFLISEHHIIRVVDVLHVYQDGVYSDNPADIERVMIKHLPQLTKSRRQEVLAYLQLESEEKKLAPVNYVALKNGIFNLDTWELQNFDPKIIIKNKIPVPYIKKAYYDVTDKTLDKLAQNDKALRKVMEEMFGYILLRRNEFGKAFVLIGDGKNGKSSFLKMIRAFAGQSNTASLDLKELGQRFKTAELFGKLINLGDDIAGEFIKDNSEFKKLTTGEVVNVERKGKDPFDFQNYSKMIFSANKMPRINDTSSGLTRRLMMIPFNATFSPGDKDYDPFIQDKLISEESMEYILQLAIHGLQRLLKNKNFSTSKKIEKEIQKYEETNNPILEFIKEDIKFENEVTTDVYQKYHVWCAENGYSPLGKIAFSREICHRCKLETTTKRVEGKRKQFFVKNG
ncbi:DNA primase family protein [Marinilactibacillus psychrotolerans]|uniref:SF3 helicase domain-containing protein n=1 Tax=Marinilactibacillus psychrotolerans TaxID=191770 RepID=A0AAV3WRB9_9LACT|nr:DNA primase family protein [Marinilactibacillus psychrotolerans]GEL67236.1 hypothetical protein MPS01_13910 [Marinilactibacillus psychrotolerans]GEQ36040.1 hypothetical protein M132T_15480 [Marinilactibacillus psychrotolerans]SDC61000.1 putative DNA primase/helicase [Marinilactibacillus psychrotolerans]